MKKASAELQRIKAKLLRSELDCRDNRNDNQFLHNQVKSLKRRLNVVEKNDEVRDKREGELEKRERRGGR